MSLLSPEIETIFELPVPRELCGMDRGEFTDFESRQPGLGYSVAYSSNDGQLTVYIYDGGDPNVSSDLRSDATLTRFKSELADILSNDARPGHSAELRKKFEMTHVEDFGPDFLGALIKGSDAQGAYDWDSFYLLGAKNQKLVKLRGTARLGVDLFDLWFQEISAAYVRLLWPERVEQYRRDRTPPIDAAPAQSTQVLLTGAAQGDRRAMSELADRYFKGEGGEARDLMQAAYWTKCAADRGNVHAQFNIGLSFSIGDGVMPDASEAAKWYRLAADQGHPQAQFNLGKAYADGEGVLPNLTEAVRWYRLAADQGYAPAQTNLGYAYSNGAGIGPDPTEAIMWYLCAAKQGYPEAQLNLADAYSRGRHVPQDPAKAAAWYRLAAEQGNAQAQLNLGVACATGDGVRRNLAKAYLWFFRAAELGLALAARNRDLAETDMTPFEFEAAQSLVEEWKRRR